MQNVKRHSRTFRVQVKQWMNGAALHVHTFLHWKRLTDPSAEEVLSLDYLDRVDPLIKVYREYLTKMVLLSSFRTTKREMNSSITEIKYPLDKETAVNTQSLNRKHFPIETSRGQ